MKLGTFIEQKKITQQQAAAALCTTQANISRWINGEMLPSPENMRKITEWTEDAVQPNDFYERDGDDAKS